MRKTTPIARSKTAALSRILDLIPKGYTRYTTGKVSVSKAARVIQKFHDRHHIGATPGQRLLRKRQGKANALLVLYWLHEAETVDWLLLFSPGELASPETLSEVTAKPRLVWLDYELVRYANRGATSWTWRRTKAEMQETYALCNDALHRHRPAVLEAALTRMANQPGFHGVREQTLTLYRWLTQHGYFNPCPPLYYVQKISHGERWLVE